MMMRFMHLQHICRFADYVVINVSSPNTKGLRDLQFDTSFLSQLIGSVQQERLSLINNNEQLSNRTGKLPPILVKIAPDMSEDQFDATVKALLDLNVDGIILSNTTVSRPSGLLSPGKYAVTFREETNNCSIYFLLMFRKG